MKSSKIRVIFLVIAILLVLLTPVYAENENEVIVLKKATNKYLVYFDNLFNNAFQFAISADETANENDLNFVSSAKDGTAEDALNVAFVDETNNPLNEEEVFIWIKDSSDNTVISGQKIDLKNNILDDDIIDFINTTTIANKDTTRIKIDTTQTQTTNSIVDGVDTTVKVGKIVIVENSGSTYSYALLPANDNTTDAGKLYELADKINNYSGNSYGKLKLAQEFYNLYLQLIPNDSDWKNVSNSEILQPEDTKSGDKFIVYIKEEKKSGEEIIDIKLLECIREEAKGENQKEETITENVQKAVKLPRTYDSIALIVIFALLVLAIVGVAILRNKHSNGKHSDK